MAAVDICRLALMRIGHQSIVSLQENSPEARACACLYAPLRDEILETFPWPFAMHRERLPEINTPPVGNYRHAYQVPSDCLRVIDIVHTSSSDPPTYVIEGRQVLTDQGSVTLHYVRRVEDVSLFSPQFVTTLSWRLAADLCLSLTREATQAKFCTEMYRFSLSQAASLQANQSRPPSAPLPAWIAARTGSRY